MRKKESSSSSKNGARKFNFIKSCYGCVFISLISMNHLFAIPYPLDDVFPVSKIDELDDLWASLENLYNPTINDYHKVQYYLKNGKRDYLNVLIDNGYLKRLIGSELTVNDPEYRSKAFFLLSQRILQNIRFVGLENEPPDFNVITLGGVLLEDKSRCIVLFASYDNDYFQNLSYASKLKQIIQELEEEGYKGHVVYRVGGYPLINQGGIRFAHIPYSFKILSLIEASSLGYDQVLWLDCSIHPTNDLSTVFAAISKNGVYLLENGVNLDYDYNYGILPDFAVLSSGIQVEELSQIPHVIATIMGVSFNSKDGHAFVEEWYNLTSKLYPAMTAYPEEFLVSIASWRVKSRVFGHVGHSLDVRSVIKTKPTQSNKPFWMDKA